MVENLYWIDGKTQPCLDHLVEGLPLTRVLLLVSYHPEYHHDWKSKTYYTQLRLSPLPPERAAALLQDLLGDDAGSHAPPPSGHLSQRMIERTEGNPFLIEESVRNLVETQA